jgi:hypothetical protein
MQRLAALVPRPRLHLIRFHGVLAAHSRETLEVHGRETIWAAAGLESSSREEKFHQTPRD